MTQEIPHRSLLRRILRRTGIIVGTLATGGLAVAMVMGGASLISARAVDIELGDSAPLVPVATQPLQIESSYQVQRAFVGQVEPRQSTDVAFEIGGTVLSVTVDEGDQVTKGQVLARLDTRTLENQKAALIAGRDAWKARAELARLTTARQQQLEDRGFATTQGFDEARLALAEITARIAETDASIAGIDIQLDKAEIRAPFAGRVGARFVDTGATTGGGQAVISLLQDADPLMRIGFAPALADTLGIGDASEVEIDGRTYEATLVQLRPDLDPATRTRVGLLRISAGDAAPIYGQTGTLRLTQTISAQGAWVPVTALQEGVRGLWTILVAKDTDDGAQTVAQEAVEVLYSDETRAYVRGTFTDGTRMISAGPHRVTLGQRVSLAEG